MWKICDGKMTRLQLIEGHRPLLAHTAVSMHGLLHIFGGRNGGTSGEGKEFDELLVLRDLGGGEAKLEVVPIEGVRPCPRSYHASATFGDKLFVFGGCFGVRAFFV